MVERDLPLTDANGIAAKAPLRALGSGLARRFAVPMEAVLFVRYADGQQRVFQSGEQVETRGQAVALLVRTTRIEVPFEFDELPARDEFWIDAACRLAVRVVPKASDLASLLDRAVGERAALTADDLRGLLETPCRACLAAYCGEREAAALTGQDHTRAVEEGLREAAAKVTFTYGLEFLGLDQLRMTSRRKGRPKRVILERARQFLLASGRQVLVYDPGTGASPTVAYEFSGRLGPLRSVRVVSVGGERHIAGGARDGVYLVRAGFASPRDSAPVDKQPVPHEKLCGTGCSQPVAAGEVREYPLPHLAAPVDKQGLSPPRLSGPVPHTGRTGVNAVAVSESRLFATHGGHGLVSWPLDRPGELGTPLHPDLTRGAEACRQVQATEDGRLVFAVGRSVAALDLKDPAGPAVMYGGATSQVTAVAWGPEALLAGTSRGEVLRWRHDAPESPEEILRKGHPVHGLALVYLDGIAHLAVAARDYAVIALDLRDLTQHLFRSPRWEVRFVAGASDFVAGIDADRATLIVWDTGAPARPAAVVPIRPLTGHSVQDLTCWREVVLPLPPGEKAPPPTPLPPGERGG